MKEQYERETGKQAMVFSPKGMSPSNGYVQWLEAENQKLREDASEVLIHDMQFHGGFLSLEAESSLGRVYAEYAVHMLNEYKADNFVTCELKAGDAEQMYYLTVGRCNGNTVQEKYQDICKEKAELESKNEELVRVLNAICVLFDNGERKITVGERANLMIANALIEKYPKEWTE
jgi:hypothetical protein